MPEREREVRELYAQAWAWIRARVDEHPARGRADRWLSRPPRAWVGPNPDADLPAIQAAVARLSQQSAGDLLDAELLARSAEVLWTGGGTSWHTSHREDLDDAKKNLDLARAWARQQARLPPAASEEAVFKSAVGVVAVVLVAAAAVTAYLVWRSRQEQKSTPSPQLRRVQDLLGTGGAAAAGARELVADAQAQVPSAWTISAALGRLGPRAEEPPVRASLAALAALPQSPVHRVDPAPGAPFDRRTMKDQSGIPEDDRKRVRVVEAPGFTIAGAIVPAQVRCETEDWFALRGGDGPVADWVRAHTGALVSEVEELCARWRAADGLQEPGLLAQTFAHDPGALAAWRDALAARLTAAYAGRDDAPRVGPEPGDLYQPAWMRLADGATGERSVVTEVLFRGLAAPGGYAIVEAVVRVTTAADQEGRV